LTYTVRYVLIIHSSVADPVCLSRIPDPIFSISDPESRVKNIPDPGFGSASKNLSILTHKNVLSSGKYDRGCSTRIRIPDPDPGFIPIPDPGAKKAPDPGSRSATLIHRNAGGRSINFATAYGCSYFSTEKRN
jgi:hypothetical protein